MEAQITELQRKERAFKRKAKLSYEKAVQLMKDAPNIAANRAYYCLYQAVVGEFEKNGWQPKDFDSIAANAEKIEDRIKWRHSIIKYNASRAGLDSRQCETIRIAYGLRIVGDYNDLDVDRDELDELLSKIPGILECLGVL